MYYNDKYVTHPERKLSDQPGTPQPQWPHLSTDAGLE